MTQHRKCECGHLESDHLEGVCSATIETEPMEDCPCIKLGFEHIDYCPCLKFNPITKEKTTNEQL